MWSFWGRGRTWWLVGAEGDGDLGRWKKLEIFAPVEW